jgi:hypothetical protein
VHRYSFTDDANDSLATANGILVNNSGQAFYSSGQLDIGNSALPLSTSSSINFVDLPNGTISSLGLEATFEAWVTWTGTSGSSWQRIFDFGTSDSGEGYSTTGSNSTYIFMTPSSGSGTYRVGYRLGSSLGTTEERIIQDTSALAINTEVHVALTWNDTTSEARLYLNGTLIDTNTTHFLLSQMQDNNNWLGRSQWPDPAFNGTYNEFRIHNIAMTDAQIAASYAAGPDTLAGDYLIPYDPSPTNGNDSVGISITLSWQSDTSTDITGHHVYMGTDYDSVLNATPSSSGIYQGTTSLGITSLPVALQADTPYYWRIEDVPVSGSTISGPMWSFQTYNPKAHDPIPVNNATGIPVADTVLQWTAGGAAISHRVYLGASAETLQLINDYYASTARPTGALNDSQTYYWRIDERQSDGSIVTGDIWNFTTIQAPAACIPGDLNGNCIVDIEDLVLLAAQWLDETDCDAFNCPDLDQNQQVNLSDMSILASNWQQEHNPQVVINEIHYHSDNNKEPVEFIELYNAGATSVDLGGWHVEDAIDYTFPAGVTLEADGYIVISQNPAAVLAKFSVSSYGPWSGKLSNEGETIVLRDAFGHKIDEVQYSPGFPWPTAVDGEGASMELLNPWLDNNLGGSWRPSGYHWNTYPDLTFGAPTPGGINSIYINTQDVPPQIRQVRHEVVTPTAGQNAQQPRTDQDVRVTAKATSPNGINDMLLYYQIVPPGGYIPAFLPVPIATLKINPYQRPQHNPLFSQATASLTMYDDGTNGDLVAGDSIYSAIIPGQIHRTLVRYRISAFNQTNQSVSIPYYDDGSLNFAYFVYDGVPAYTANAATVQAAGAPYTYTAQTMSSLPAYTLITRAEDFYQCNGYIASDRIDQTSADFNLQEAGKAYNWSGTLIYNGEVYDNIGYRLRGGNGRYNNGRGGKRSMKFRFNRCNYFQAHDIYGDKFPTRWQHLVTGKMLGNHYGFEGYDGYMYGINEILDMRLWNIIGVPATEGSWFTFRVIDGADEAPATSTEQYDGDFYGLYIAWEDYDGAFLERRGLPDGNLYKLSDKIYEGPRQLRFQAPDAVADASDYENIRWNLRASSTATFIQDYMDTDAWIRYQTIKEAVRHYDQFSGAYCVHCLKNSAWYFYPEYTAANNYLGRIWFMPFDVDDTWGPYFNMGVDHGKAAIFDQAYESSLVQYTLQPAKAPIKQDYRNYLREFRDLFWQTDIVLPMIDEMAAIIASIVPADRDRWRLEPGFTGSTRSDPGPLENVVAGMKSFAFQPTSVYAYWPGSSANLDTLSNTDNDSTNIPDTPAVTYTGPEGYPSNALTFQTSAFSDPQGSGTFAAMKWRIAEYETINLPSSLSNEITLIDKAAQQWRGRGGNVEPSAQIGAWRLTDFDDSGWPLIQIPVGYDTSGTPTMNFDIPDMQNNYCTFYLRKKFSLSNPTQITSLRFEVLFDDGFNLWINGQRVLYDNVPSENLPYDYLLGNSMARENNNYITYDVPNASQYLIAGTNQVAIHVVNSTSSSSDCFFDMKLVGVGDGTVTAQMTLKKHAFEIQPNWESDEITPFVSTIHIPGSAVKADRFYRVRCKMKDTTGRWSHWSAPMEFVSGTPLAAGVVEDLRITELMYNPAAADVTRGELNLDNNEFEFIELQNTGDQPLDISNVSMTHGVTFSFSTAPAELKTLAAGEIVLLVKNQAAFESRYGTAFSSRIGGVYSGKLANDGETVTLSDYWNGTIVSFDYNDGYGWPIPADGAGHSLVPIDSAIPNENDGWLQYGGNWRASTYINGSPGIEDPASIAGIMINEVMARTDYSNPSYPDYDSNDWIELYNPTGSPVGYDSNWYLSDDTDDLKKWALPGGSIPSGGRISFDEVTGFHSPITSGFGLDKTGDYVLLSYLPGTSADRVVDSMRFSGQYNNTSWGRYTDGGDYWFFLASPGTRSTANANPIQRPVIISEIMYHPDEMTCDDEYIELYNPTGSAANLYNANGAWQLDNAVSYVFPSSISIPAGGKIVVVPFDPATETEHLAAFNAAYGCSLTANSTIFGPWTGNLSNSGERIVLQEPQETDPITLTTWWINIDRVIYGDCSPWPTSPDGNGDALVRQSSSASASGDDPANWTADTPSVGY